MKIREIILGIIMLFAFVYVGVVFYNKQKDKNVVQRQKLNLSIDIGKLLFINTVLENKDKTRKQIDSIYEIRKDSILDRVKPTH